jgi:hypothetical protein
MVSTTVLVGSSGGHSSAETLDQAAVAPKPNLTWQFVPRVAQVYVALVMLVGRAALLALRR